EDLFRGIFLASGYVADALPEIRDHMATNYLDNQEQLNEVKRRQDLIVQQVARDAPGFFYELEQAVSHKNPVQVRNMIEQGVVVLQNALAILEMTPDPAQQEEAVQRIKDRMGADNSPDALKAAINAEVQNSLLPVVVLPFPPVIGQCLIAYCYVVIVAYVDTASFGAEHTNLLKDQLIASIVTKL
ncbi:MAG TPA: hypothetical protein PKC40_10795, partial [Saprospiraceae bacterium]|nr:hypothetical protein [Saprospiraceae bacterium]